MPWGTVVIMLAAALGVALFVSWPLLSVRARQDTDGDGGEEDAPMDQLLVQKEAVYSAIKELEFDHAMGNLSKEDYRELAGRYEDRAVALLQTIDEVAEEVEMSKASVSPAVAGARTGQRRLPGSEDAIEQEVAAIRAGRRPGPGNGMRVEDEIEAEIAALRSARRRSALPDSQPVAPPQPTTRTACSHCGSPLRSATAAFCARCGASLRECCPQCSEPVDRGDAFCSGCGAPLSSPRAALPGGTNG